MGFRGKDEAVSKGPVVRALEEISTHVDAKSLLEILRDEIRKIAPDGFEGLGQVLRDNLLAHWSAISDPDLIDEMTSYLNEKWFLDESNEFGPSTREIYARGILSALDSSLRGGSKPIPIESIWMVNHSRVEMVVLERPNVVFLLIFTPETRDKRYEGKDPRAACNAWVTTESTKLFAFEVDATKLDPGKPREDALVDRDPDGKQPQIPARVATYRITGAISPQ